MALKEPLFIVLLYMILFTYEEINERASRTGYGRYYNYVILNKKGELVFYGNPDDTSQWIKDNCYKKIAWNDYPSWGSRIIEWVEKSIEKKQKYKGYKFEYYTKKWERQLKIQKILNIK